MKDSAYLDPIMKKLTPSARQSLLIGLIYLVSGWNFKADGNDDFQGATHMMPFEEDTIDYGDQQDTSLVARLQEAINQGEVELEFKNDGQGYLLSLLEKLKIPIESQLLVFSKTSFQRHKISPSTPRALYFDDNSYVGFVQGSDLLEISAVDKELGGVFYTLEQDPDKKPNFVRTDQCLECHASSKTMGVPGHVIRSFEVDEIGVVDLISGTSQVSHRTPFEDRWGGWYVTGQHGKQIHRGNLFGKTAFKKQEESPNYLGNLDELKQFFNPSPYPLETSDIAALMVLEHQGHMHNFITRMQYEAQLMLNAYGHLRYLKHKIDAFLRYMLFIDEVPLTDTVHSSSGYTKAFTSMGPEDSKGRSLRDFNLETRIFEYPCSYLIYSEAFQALPEKLKAEIYNKLWKILTGENNQPEFSKLTVTSRKAIHDILKETLPDLPNYW
jgi:hypothetical protein